MGRILKRCDVCKRFHAAYVVDDPLYPGGKAKYCYSCWKAKFGDAQDPAEPNEKKLPPTSPVFQGQNGGGKKEPDK